MTANASNRGPIVASSSERPSNDNLALLADIASDGAQPTKKARTLNDHYTCSTALASNRGPTAASSSEHPSNDNLALMADVAPDDIQPTKKARTINDQNTCSMDGLSGPSQDFFPAVGEDPEKKHSIAKGEDSESTQPTQKRSR